MTETTTGPSQQTGGTDSHSIQYERDSNEPLSVAVANAVAAVIDTDVTELEALHYTVDTEALERLFEPRASGSQRRGTVRFQYSGCRVIVNAPDEIVVEPLS